MGGKKEKKEGGKKEREFSWGEKEGNACYNDPVLFTFEVGGDRKF